MSSTTFQAQPQHATPIADGRATAAAQRGVNIAAHQAFWLLRIGFTVAPIPFGVDKFFNWTVQWPDYLASWINEIQPFASGQDFMYFAGGVEIAAGLLVALAPRFGALWSPGGCRGSS